MYIIIRAAWLSVVSSNTLAFCSFSLSVIYKYMFKSQDFSVSGLKKTLWIWTAFRIVGTSLTENKEGPKFWVQLDDSWKDLDSEVRETFSLLVLPLYPLPENDPRNSWSRNYNLLTTDA